MGGYLPTRIPVYPPPSRHNSAATGRNGLFLVGENGLVNQRCEKVLDGLQLGQAYALAPRSAALHLTKKNF